MTPVSVVIPCYHSEESLPSVLAAIAETMSGQGREYEIIPVNDGSRDGTLAVLREAAEENPAIRPIDLLRNYGQHNAVLCGIRAAQHPFIVTMDDDGQHPPSQLPLLLARLEEGSSDVVYGYPSEEKHSFWRVAAAGLTKFALARFMGSEIARHVTSLRAFRTPLREGFADYQGSYVSIDVLLTWSTNRFDSLPVKHLPRELGTSQYTFRKLVTHALDLITGFSVVPLQIASVLGVLAFIFGGALLCYILVMYFVGGAEVRGFTFLASSIVLFGGVQLLAIGIIGEYVARIHFQSMGRPAYTKRSRPSEEES